MNDPENFAFIGVGTMLTAIGASLILWYTLYRFVRWVLG